MDRGDCLNKGDSHVEMEEGEIEDGELDEFAEDGAPTKSTNQSIFRDENVSQSPNYHDRKKKSKKRKREETDKVYHSSSDRQRKSPNNCDSLPFHDTWIGNDRNFAGNDQNRAQKSPYDSPCSSAEEYGNDNISGGFYGEQICQNDDESYEPTHRIRRRGRHKGKKTKRSLGSDTHYFENHCYGEVYGKREPDSYKTDIPKPFKHGSNKKKIFNSSLTLADKVPTCKYFLEGKCFKGDECSFSHCSQFQKKEELCRHYLAGGCKKNSCQFYHGDWPCRDFHLKGECGNGEFCKFSHYQELTEEIENLLYAPGSFGESFNKRSSEDSQRLCHDDRKKIPSLLDIEIFPPGHFPKRPSPSHRGGFRGNMRTNRVNKFSKGQKKGGSTNMSFHAPSFGVDNPNTYGNDFMKQDIQKPRQGWGRKPYGMDWCKKDRYEEEHNANEVSNQADYSREHFECNSIKGLVDINEVKFPPIENKFNENKESYKSLVPSKGIREDEGNYTDNEDGRPDISDPLISTRNQKAAINYISSPDGKHKPNFFQNVNDAQVPNMLGMNHPILRIPPPSILPMQGNVIRGLNMPNSVSCPQPGILGAPPLGGPLLQNLTPHGMTSHHIPRHLNLPQLQGIQSTQIINQFVPSQPPLAGILGRNPREMFPSNVPPVNNQQFLQLPPFPPPRFDFNQIIRNIVRNTLNTQSSMFMVNPPSPMAAPIMNIPCIPVTDIVHSIHPEDPSPCVNSSFIINSNNNNPLNTKVGVDPRLKNKEEKTEAISEDESRQSCKVEDNEMIDEKVPEIDGTAKQIEYCLRPLVLGNCKPSVPVEVLMNFRDDLSSCEDPRLKVYSRSLSDFKFDNGDKLHDPRNHLKKEIRNSNLRKSEFSPPALLSPTDSSNNIKPYTLPDIFIPPTSAPNIELEEKALSANKRFRLRKNSDSLFSPSRDLANLFPDFTNQQDLQQIEVSMKKIPPPRFEFSAFDNMRLPEKGQKKVIDYRNDPRFKKKLRTKSEDGLKEAGKCNEVILKTVKSSISTDIHFGKPAVHKSPILRISSPNPTFPRYCTNYEMSGMFMSNSTDEPEDIDNESIDENSHQKGNAFMSECEADVLPSLPSMAPFLPEGKQSPKMMEEINLKDMFKTIDPTTSPFC